MEAGERKTVAVEVDAETLAEARRKDIPVAAIAERAIRRAVRDRRTPAEREALAKAWRDENVEALAATRAWNETHPLPLAHLQVLQVADPPVDRADGDAGSEAAE